MADSISRFRALWEANDSIQTSWPERGSPVALSAQTLETFAHVIVRDVITMLDEESVRLLEYADKLASKNDYQRVEDVELVIDKVEDIKLMIAERYKVKTN